jgi:ABC-type lipoprotein export system ATPase subunit
MIELQSITKTYNRAGGPPVHALRDFSLRIGRGDFLAIVGSSGSGKSTLMSILGVLDRPTAGRYLYDGQDVAGFDARQQARFRNARVGFVFQAFHLLPRTSALDNVELPLLYSGRAEIEGRGRKALEAVGLADRMHHTPSELSGGQQQRVAIARALVNEPDLLLADEPTGNLDARSALEIMAILRDLNRAGKTIVLVTHDAAMAEHAGRVVTIEDGVLRAQSRVPGAEEAARSTHDAAPRTLQEVP